MGRQKIPIAVSFIVICIGLDKARGKLEPHRRESWFINESYLYLFDKIPQKSQKQPKMENLNKVLQVICKSEWGGGHI